MVGWIRAQFDSEGERERERGHSRDLSREPAVRHVQRPGEAPELRKRFGERPIERVGGQVQAGEVTEVLLIWVGIGSESEFRERSRETSEVALEAGADGLGGVVAGEVEPSERAEEAKLGGDVAGEVLASEEDGGNSAASASDAWARGAAWWFVGQRELGGRGGGEERRERERASEQEGGERREGGEEI